MKIYSTPDTRSYSRYFNGNDCVAMFKDGVAEVDDDFGKQMLIDRPDVFSATPLSKAAAPAPAVAPPAPDQDE